MPNLSDWVPGKIFRCLVIAPYKGGKTWGAGTFPRPNFLDFDKGIATLRNPEFVTKYGLRPIQYEQFAEKSVNKNGVITAHNAFDDACRYFDEWMKTGKRDQFDAWVIDSATWLSNYAANKAMFLLGSDGTVGAASNTWKQAVQTGLIVEKKQDYGAERSMVEQFIAMVNDSGKHVVVCCHEKVLTSEDGKVVTGIVPLLTGKSVSVVSSMFDEIYYIEKKLSGPNTNYILKTKQTPIYRIGSRMGMPEGTSWEWDAIQREVEKIRAAQAMTGNSQSSAKP